MNSLFGISRKLCPHYDMDHDNGPLAILCHVVYATLGSTMDRDNVTQIKIDTHRFGIAGLKKAFENMAETYAEQSDDVVAEELLNRLSKKNYIPEKVQKKYGRAFVREFRRFLEQPFDDENSQGLEIKVLGVGCVVCDSLENQVMEALTEMNLAAELEHIRDADQIAEFKVKGTPALIINGKVMCSGTMPSKNEIINWRLYYGRMW